jgi:uncharacterized protein
MSSQLQKLLQEIEDFEWDEGNSTKNWEKHNVAQQESEEVFFQQLTVLFDDEVHSETEKRYGLYGETKAERGLTITFTIRNKKIRIISARNQSKRERASFQAYKAVYLQKRKKGA